MSSARSGASKRVVEETRNLFSAVLSSPLGEDQLTRPSFKFIQDLTKSLITETRSLRDVFNPSDFETRKKVWDRRMKVDFIQRLIDYCARNEQPVFGCVPEKVVSGLEPNKTNELLQALARIARARSSDSASNRSRTFTKSQEPSKRPPNAVPPKQLRPMTITKTAARRTAIEKDSTLPVARMSSGRTSSTTSIKRESADHGSKHATSPNDSNSTGRVVAKQDESKRGQTEVGGKPDALTISSRVSPKDADKSVIPSNEEVDLSWHVPQLKVALKQLKETIIDVEQLDEHLRRMLPGPEPIEPN